MALARQEGRRRGVEERSNGPRSSIPLLLPLLLSLALTSGSAPAALAQAELLPGQVTERVISPTDTTQQYAVYLPSTYGAGRRWPLLILMDPRGRALVPMELARPAAERLGWLVMSSYGTVSDAPGESNLAAINAMLADAQATFALDERRIYFAGFSGTARFAWAIAQELPQYVAGIIGFGAGMPPLFRPGSVPVPWFGGAGNVDYNYDEVHRLGQQLAASLQPHRVVRWTGPHAWPPESVMGEALAWLELQAQLGGLIPADLPRVRAFLAADMQRADDALAGGFLLDAVARYRGIARDYGGVADSALIARRLAELAARADFRTLEVELERAVLDNIEHANRILAVLRDVRAARTPPTPERLQELLRVDELRRRAEGGSEAALGARRALEHMLVFAAFYEPRQYIAERRLDRALLVLSLAEAIRPGHPGACALRAEALEGLGRTEEAAQARACAAARP